MDIQWTLHARSHSSWPGDKGQSVQCHVLQELQAAKEAGKKAGKPPQHAEPFRIGVNVMITNCQKWQTVARICEVWLFPASTRRLQALLFGRVQGLRL